MPPRATSSRFAAFAAGTEATAAAASASSYRATGHARGSHHRAPARDPPTTRRRVPGRASRITRIRQTRNSGAAPTTSMSGSPTMDQASSTPARTGTHHRGRAQSSSSSRTSTGIAEPT